MELLRGTSISEWCGPIGNDLGRPFHIDNLVVMWASVTAFGETECGNHQQIHHRQLLQSFYDAINTKIGKNCCTGAC